MRPLNFLKNKSYQTPRISRLYLQLRSKFALSFLLLILVPFLLFLYASYIHSKTVLEKNTWEMSVNILKYNEKALYKLLEELAIGTDAVADDPVIWLHLQSALFSNFNSATAAKFEGAYIFEGDNITAAWQKENQAPVFNKPSTQKWFVKAAANPSSAYICGTNQRFYSEGKNAMVFSVACSIRSESSTSPLILLIDFDFRLLEDIMEPAKDSFSGEKVILADSTNTVIYSTDTSSLTLPLDNEMVKIASSMKRGLVPHGTGKTRELLTCIVSEDGNWTFIRIIPSEALLSRLVTFDSPFVRVCLILCPLLLILYFIVSSMHLNPINELTAVISGYERSTNPKKFFLPDSDNGHYNPDNNASSEIGYLINKVYDIRLKQKEAELNSLQNQINPHFLYNTLESIRGAALYNGIHEIAAMSKALSLLFRYSISDKPLVTIKEELGHLENYMSIQNFRYENRFELVLSIPPEFYSYQILKLTLQPLIENSIKHGLEMKLGKGTIKIEIISLNKSIKIQVSDNGIGMNSKKIEELNRSLSANEFSREGMESGESSSAGIGVRNVNSRIKLYFGEQYGLSFKEAYTGTIVELILPAVKED